MSCYNCGSRGSCGCSRRTIQRCPPVGCESVCLESADGSVALTRLSKCAWDLSIAVDSDTTYTMTPDLTTGEVVLTGSDGSENRVNVCDLIAAACPPDEVIQVTGFGYDEATNSLNIFESNGDVHSLTLPEDQNTHVSVISTDGSVAIDATGVNAEGEIEYDLSVVHTTDTNTQNTLISSDGSVTVDATGVNAEGEIEYDISVPPDTNTQSSVVSTDGSVVVDATGLNAEGETEYNLSVVFPADANTQSSVVSSDGSVTIDATGVNAEGETEYDLSVPPDTNTQNTVTAGTNVSLVTTPNPDGTVNYEMSSVDTDTQNTVTAGTNVSVTETTNPDGTTNYELSSVDTDTQNTVTAGTNVSVVETTNPDGSVNYEMSSVDTNTQASVISSDGSVTVDATGVNAEGETEYDISVPPGVDTNTQNTLVSSDGSVTVDATGVNAEGEIEYDISVPPGVDTNTQNTVTAGTNVAVTETANPDGTTNYEVASTDTNTQASVISSDGSITVDATGVNAEGEIEYDISVPPGVDTNTQNTLISSDGSVTVDAAGVNAEGEIEYDISVPPDTNTQSSVVSSDGSITVDATGVNAEGETEYDISVVIPPDTNTQNTVSVVGDLTISQTPNPDGTVNYELGYTDVDVHNTVTSADSSIAVVATTNPDGSTNYDLAGATGGVDTNTQVTVVSSDGSVAITDAGPNAEGESEFDLSVVHPPHNTVSAGTNITVTQTTNPDGSTNYEIVGAGGGAALAHTDACIMAFCGSAVDEVDYDASSSIGAASYNIEYSGDGGTTWLAGGTTATGTITDTTLYNDGGLVRLTTTSADGVTAVSCIATESCAAPSGAPTIVEFDGRASPQCLFFDADLPHVISYENGWYLPTSAGGTGNNTDPTGTGISARTVTLNNPNAFPVIVPMDVNLSSWMFGPFPLSRDDIGDAKHQLRIAEVSDPWLLEVAYPYFAFPSFSDVIHRGNVDRRWLFQHDAESRIGITENDYNYNNVTGIADDRQIGASSSHGSYITLDANESITLAFVRWSYREQDNPVAAPGDNPIALHFGYNVHFAHNVNACCGEAPVTFASSSAALPNTE